MQHQVGASVEVDLDLPAVDLRWRPVGDAAARYEPAGGFARRFAFGLLTT